MAPLEAGQIKAACEFPALADRLAGDAGTSEVGQPCAVTLSKVAAARFALSWLVSAKPTYIVDAMVIALVPCGVQVTPSGEW
jgi:hypothetical protein